MDWQHLSEHGPVYFVTAFLIYAAYIDGKELRVPNWLTFPMMLLGLVYNTWAFGMPGLGWSFVGLLVGLFTLLPLYSIGGMGSGDVKMMMAMGSWLGWHVTWDAFVVSVVVGALMALVMVAYRGTWKHHLDNCKMLLTELIIYKNPWKIADNAAERKSKMLLLPYGIPICIGSIGYFFYAGMM